MVCKKPFWKGIEATILFEIALQNFHDEIQLIQVSNCANFEAIFIFEIGRLWSKVFNFDELRMSKRSFICLTKSAVLVAFMGRAPLTTYVCNAVKNQQHSIIP
jgi:hypothetical protein